jgi:hypothetical protein
MLLAAKNQDQRNWDLTPKPLFSLQKKKLVKHAFVGLTA